MIKDENNLGRQKIKVGIVTPTHNSGETIKDAILSVLKQSYYNFEIFVVDDHSVDDTLTIVKELSVEDKRIHILRLEDGSGAAAARNLAIKCIEKDASLRYVAFLDSDDLWRKDKLKTQVEFMEENEVPFSYGDYDIFDIKLNDRKHRYRSCPKHMSYLRMLIGCSVGCLTVMYDKNATGHVSIPNLPKRNDYALWCLILKKVRHGSRYPGNLAIYRKSENTISSGNKLFLIKHHYNVHRKVNHFGPTAASFFTLTNIINYVRNVVVYEKTAKKAIKDVK